MTPRIAAYETLLLCDKEKQFSNIAVNNGIAKYHFEGRDRDLYTRLVYGVIERQLTIDYFIQQCTQKSIKRLDKSVVIILRLSIYQIKFLDKIPNSAAVSEGVKLAARFASRAKGYINAVLRRACEETIVYPSQEEPAEYLSVRYSVDKEICALLLSQYKEKTEEILAAYHSIPQICFQINAAKHSPESFIRTYELSAETVPPLPFAVKMKESVSLSSIGCIENGDAFVQDIASQLASLVLDPQPHMTVIDVCACPGGKSLAAANLMTAKCGANVGSSQSCDVSGSIISCDIHESKLSLIETSAQRLGFSFIKTICHDATHPMPQYRGKAHRVICDVPCSGLGVIAKKPEVRYKDILEIEALPELQYQILKASSEYLTEDGILVYSTCTVNQKENEEVVSRFLTENPDFEAVDFVFSSQERTFQSKNGVLTLLPQELHDGFFMAKIQRKVK